MFPNEQIALRRLAARKALEQGIISRMQYQMIMASLEETEKELQKSKEIYEQAKRKLIKHITA